MLIVVISFLPSQKPTKRDSYADYVTTTTTNASRRLSTAPEDHKPAPEVPVSEKQIVCVDNADAVVGAAKATLVQESEPVPLVQEVKEYFYMRSRSERVDRGEGKGRELMMRRSETLIKHTSSTTSEEAQKERRSSSGMDDMSSEEFKKTIDIFIAAKKKTLIKENTVVQSGSHFCVKIN